MRLPALTFSLATLTVVSALTPHLSYAQTLYERVQDLERRVQRLESRGSVDPAISSPTRRDLGNWRTLRRGMSQDEVGRALGAPDRVDAIGPRTTVWHYDFGGRVEFDNRGVVEGWGEPRR